MREVFVRHSIWVCTLICALASAEAAASAPLTCNVFQRRLHEAIAQGGDKVAYPDPYVQDRDDPGIGKKLSWKGIVGLDGGLSCGPNGEFESLSAALNMQEIRGADQFTGAGLRLVHLAAASIAALTSSPYNQAEKLATNMFGVATHNFQASVAKGERMPGGLNDVFLFDGVDGEFDVTPLGASWLLGPQNGHVMDEARLTLKPQTRDNQ